MKNIYAIIVAAGRGRRFGGDLPKQYCQLGGNSVLHHTLERFCTHPMIKGVRVIIHGDDRELFEASVQGLDVMAPVLGGATRQESVLNGLESLVGLSPDMVLIHDAARPFVDHGLIDRVIDAIAPQKGVIPAVRVADTLKRGRDLCCGETVDRTDLWRAQTPQGFLFGDIYKGHLSQIGAELTDDAAVMEAQGMQVVLSIGHEDNFKITTREDLDRAQKMVEAEMEYRTGSGFDVHRFCDGDSVTLCGVSVPHSQGLSGHSDADVALHALTDALLGAIGEGDIGSHFPPSDMQWKGASSDRFLMKACELVAARGGSIVNMDLTIICELPKVGPYREAMRQKIAEIAGVDLHRVSVKGTTTEKLGFTGRKEGIAAQAVVNVKLPV